MTNQAPPLNEYRLLVQALVVDPGNLNPTNGEPLERQFYEWNTQLARTAEEAASRALVPWHMAKHAHVIQVVESNGLRSGFSDETIRILNDDPKVVGW